MGREVLVIPGVSAAGIHELRGSACCCRHCNRRNQIEACQLSTLSIIAVVASLPLCSDPLRQRLTVRVLDSGLKSDYLLGTAIRTLADLATQGNNGAASKTVSSSSLWQLKQAPGWC